jgi:hypothetical protein
MWRVIDSLEVIPFVMIRRISVGTLRLMVMVILLDILDFFLLLPDQSAEGFGAKGQKIWVVFFFALERQKIIKISKA